MTYQVKKTDDGYFVSFNSIQDVIDTADSTARGYISWTLRPPSFAHRENLPFADKGLDDVVEWLDSGWLEGYKIIEENFGNFILPPMPSVKKRRRFTDSGDDICTDRFLAGQYDRMYVSRKAETVIGRRGNTHLTIAVETCAGRLTKSHTLAIPALAACKLAEAATLAGYSVKIVLVTAGRCLNGTTDNVHVTVTLKDYNEPFNFEDFVTYAGSGILYRAILITLLHKIHIDESVATSYASGSVHDFDKTLLDGYTNMAWFPRDVQTYDSANKALNDAAKALTNRVRGDLKNYRKSA